MISNTQDTEQSNGSHSLDAVVRLLVKPANLPRRVVKVEATLVEGRDVLEQLTYIESRLHGRCSIIEDQVIGRYGWSGRNAILWIKVLGVKAREPNKISDRRDYI
jgi:hypothetical protein